MIATRRRLLMVSAAAVGVMSVVSTHAIAQAPPRTIGNNESVFIDGKALTITQGTAKDDVASKTANLGARDLGPGAIIFRSGEKLYIVDPSLPPLALNDPNIDRQRSYGGLYDRQQSYGGLNDDRQRSYGGLYDRQQSYGGLNDDRQRSYGGLYDRQQSYGGFYDSAAEWRRQQSYGGLNDDRQRSYGGLYDPDYVNYKLKKTFEEVWGPGPTEKK
jgi:hypothetical protein